MQQQVERPLVNGQPKADRRVGLYAAWSGAVAHSSTRAIALIIGLITFSTESVYSSTSRMRKPNGSSREYAIAALSGNNETTTRPPSSGSNGNRLKTASTTLITTDARSM